MTRPLSPNALRWDCPLEALGFETTAELEPCDDIVGQESAAEALRFGLAFRAPGQHVFVRGEEGTGRLALIRNLLAGAGPLPGSAHDRVVVMDFEVPDRPALLSLGAGRAPAFVKAMNALTEFIREDLVGEVETTVAVAKRELDLAAESALAEHAGPFEKGLTEAGLALARVTDEDGESETRVLPVVNGEPVQVSELEAAAARGDLAPEQLAATMAAITRFTGHLADVTRHAKAVQRDHHHKIDRLFSEAAASVLEARIAPLAAEFPLAVRFFDQIRKHTSESFPALVDEPVDFVRAFEVNVLLTRPPGSPRPVVVENAPSVQTLLGTIDVPTDESTPPHLGIRAGALLRADGGTLILEARALLRRDGAWEALSRCLRTSLVELLPDEAPTTLRPPGIKPAAIPIDVKVVLHGDDEMYYVLDQGDPDFPLLFKVLADLDPTLPADTESIRAYARVVAGLARREGLPSFQRGAVAALVEHGARIAAQKGKLTARLGRLADIAREAAFLANGAPVVRDHVLEAIHRTKKRADGPGRRFREQVASGAIRILTEGRAMGEINGLAVIQAGPLTYGMPTRITASAGPGTGGPVNVEQEALLSGQIHVKSFHILTGLLRRLVHAPHPLAFDASIAFEQSYGGIDGDSASGASFVVLLSALTGEPIRQDLAMTGAIDQVGNVLPVGAVNEKIEGFFDCCNAAGLSGSQGVIIPAANAGDLMLRHNVVQAAQGDAFAIWPVSRIEEAVELFFGQPAEDVLQRARDCLEGHWRAAENGVKPAWSLRRQIKRTALDAKKRGV
ncbi:MAG: AAA family ATPase [Alphaproteobacteria bacterium]|nr:AAA family ATPase [Alphaproteobacteria bacterium]